MIIVLGIGTSRHSQTRIELAVFCCEVHVAISYLLLVNYDLVKIFQTKRLIASAHTISIE